jgi:hypothetical protein
MNLGPSEHIVPAAFYRPGLLKNAKFADLKRPGLAPMLRTISDAPVI